MQTNVRRSLSSRRSARASARQGAAAVEFAVIAPLFVTLVLTAAQSSFNLDAAHTMYATIRQAGRLASMESSERQQAGQSKNNKVIQDIRNQLIAEGIPGQHCEITITDAETGGPFDLSDSANDLGLFRISINVPYSALNIMGAFPTQDSTMRASVVFRKGRTTLVN